MIRFGQFDGEINDWIIVFIGHRVALDRSLLFGFGYKNHGLSTLLTFRQRRCCTPEDEEKSIDSIMLCEASG
jgi:hypothetical protein